MKKYRVGIIEDEFDAQRILTKYLQDSPYEFEEIRIASNYKEGIEMIESFHPELLFVDINLDGESGIELIACVNPQSIVIFTTAHAEYAIEALRLKAQDYLLKPIPPFDFKIALKKAVDELDGRKSEGIKDFVVNNTDGTHIIKFSDLVLIEASGSYSTLHLLNDERILVSKPLNYFEELFSSQKDLLRCHKSYLINTNWIQTVVYGEGLLKMKNGISLPFSRSLRQDFKRFK